MIEAPGFLTLVYRLLANTTDCRRIFLKKWKRCDSRGHDAFEQTLDIEIAPEMVVQDLLALLSNGRHTQNSDLFWANLDLRDIR